MDFKEWLTDQEWKALRTAIEVGREVFINSIKKKKPKTESKKLKIKKPKGEDLHKWLMEQRKSKIY